MQKKYRYALGTLLIAVALLGIGGFVFLQKAYAPTQEEAKDELTGTWHGGGTTSEGYEWFVDYTFQNGTYDMKTDSTFQDNGTYQITKRFEDNVSLQITKTSIPFNKTYDIYISLIDENTIMIDGMKLQKQAK